MRSLLIFACLLPCLAQQGLTTLGVGKAASGGGSPASFVNSAKCAGASGCTVSSISIPSGYIIVVGVSTLGANPSGTVSDSNSDSSSCGAAVAETAANGNAIQLCLMKAGATVTTVTCTTTFANNADCLVAWYSPGSLAVTLDKSTGQDQPNTQTWTSGNTATLTSSNELVVGMWGGANTTLTSTYSDGGTERITGGTNTGCALEDRAVSSSSAVAASGTYGGATYTVAAVITVK